jgi:hypothetical protein
MFEGTGIILPSFSSPMLSFLTAVFRHSILGLPFAFCPPAGEPGATPPNRRPSSAERQSRQRRQRRDRPIHNKRSAEVNFGRFLAARFHLSLGKDSPEPRSIQPEHMGRVVALPQIGGLHHRYERRAPETLPLLNIVLKYSEIYVLTIDAARSATPRS